MSAFKEVKFDPEGKIFFFAAEDSSGRKEEEVTIRWISLGVGTKNQPDEKGALAVAALLLPPSKIEIMDEVDLKFKAMVNLIKFKIQQVDYESLKKLGKTFSGFTSTDYWQKFNSFFQLMLDNWDPSGWEKIGNDYKEKLDQAERDEQERKTREREEEIIKTRIGNVRLPGELEKRYQGKPGEVLLKYLFLNQEIGERDHHNRGGFGPDAVANSIHDRYIFPGDEISRKNNEIFYRLLADFSGRQTFSREDFAREIVAIYPWLEENISKDDLDGITGERYQLGELVRRIKKEFKF